MTKSVFISSTYIDLKEERRKIWQSLTKFDVSVMGMEEFGARSDDPLTTCLNEVEQCDIYIGIFGMRYGSINEESGKSYSQLEYEAARSKGKAIFIYILDEDNSKVIPSLIQYDKIEKLNTFKSVLRKRHTVDTFSDAIDLVSKLERKFKEMFAEKETTESDDNFSKTEKLLEGFFLVPGAYNGREIKIEVKFCDDMQPASREIYSTFNLEFGKTVLVDLEVIKPSISAVNFQNLILEYKDLAKYNRLDKSVNHILYANLLFSPDKVKNKTTKFEDIKYPDDPYEDMYGPPYDDDGYSISSGAGLCMIKFKDVDS